MSSLRVEPRFKKDDYIINHSSGDIAIVAKVTPKNYYKFKVYYNAMFDELKDVSLSTNDIQVNYQKFFEPCTEEERKRLDEIVKDRKWIQ